DMVYIDSTADDVDADMLESGGPSATDFELQEEARRVSERLAFLRTVASLWKKAALSCGPKTGSPLASETLQAWHEQATMNERNLLELLQSVNAWRIPSSSAARESLLEYDRRRSIKEALTDKVVSTAIETGDGAKAIRAALSGAVPAPASQGVLD